MKQAETGDAAKTPVREITYAGAIKEAMCEEMRRDPAIFLFGEDVGTYGGAFGVSGGMIRGVRPGAGP